MTETTPARAAQALGLDANAAQGQELSPLDRRIARTRTMQLAFADAVASGLKPETLVRDAITALRNTPDLVKCDEGTFFGALMSAAQLGLRPNVPSLGHGWVLPFWSGRRQRHEAQWVLGYQGMVELGYKSGLVAKIATDTIYSNEHYQVRRGTDDVLVHEPILDAAERGDVVAHYAIVWLQTGQPLWKVMGDQDVRTLMQRMAAKDRQGNIVGPWRDDYVAMAQKTPLRALWRFMPKTPAMALALTTDEVVREGMDKDAAVQHDAEAVTITRTDTPDVPQEAASEPQGSEPVDAVVVAERGKQRNTAARTAAFRAAAEKHGPRLHDAMHAVIGERVDDPTWTEAELVAALTVDLAAWDDAQLDAAAQADGA